MRKDHFYQYYRKSTKEIIRLKYIGNNMYITDSGEYKFASNVLKYYERAKRCHAEYRLTPNGFKIQLTKRNYDTYSHLERPTPYATKQKSSNSVIEKTENSVIEKTNANQDPVSEGVREGFDGAIEGV